MVGRDELGGVYTVRWWQNVRIQEEEWVVYSRGREFCNSNGHRSRCNSGNTPPMLCMSSQFGPRLIAGDDILCNMDIRLRPRLVDVHVLLMISKNWL